MASGSADIVDLTGDDFVLNRPSDVLELVGRDIAAAILADRQLHADFFDLSTGFAGEVVQKSMNYKLRVAIVAADTSAWSPRFREFADESTRQGHFVFVKSVDAGMARLGG